MHNEFFYALEQAQQDTEVDVNDLLGQLAFNADGLIPVVTQCADSGDVLMLAWMNDRAIRLTLDTGRVTYWSRSRQQFWIKGESSGHSQALQELRVDCDGDTLLCRVHQQGPACHTGRADCFYFTATPGGSVFRVLSDPPQA